MFYKTFAVVVGSLITSLALANGAISTTSQKNTSNSTQHSSMNKILNSNYYALDMLKNFNQHSADKNLVFSPYSLQIMLSILKQGADPLTQRKMGNAWHYTKEASSDIPKHLTSFTQQNNKSGESKNTAQLNIANSLLINKKYQIAPDFQQNISDYKVQIESVDFTSKKTVTNLNQWVNKQTYGLIPNIIEKFQDPKNTIMTITNAIAFQGQWPEKTFLKENTTKRPFYGLKTSQVPTMVQHNLTHYYEDDNLQAIYLPYKGHKYALFVIIPKEKSSHALDNLLEKLNINYFNDLSMQLLTTDRYQGTLYLPRFQIAYSNDKLVTQSEQLLNINLSKSTFNNIIQQTDPEKTLTLSSMVHKAVITVDEKGTKAAAVTHAQIGVTSIPMPKQTKSFIMDVNRPFIYGIVDKTQQLYFLGTVKTLP